MIRRALRFVFRHRRRLLLVTLVVTAVAVGFTLRKIAIQGGWMLPNMPAVRAGQAVLILAPHEDDEALGAGGLIQQAIQAGARVYVCFMTAGEGEEMAAIWTAKRPVVAPRTFVKLGQVRQRESLLALSRLGVPRSHVFFLNYPNMGLSQMWQAPYWPTATPWTSPFTRTSRSPFAGGQTPNAPFSGAACLNDLQTLMSALQPAMVLTTHPADIHPDHWATYCFAKLALEDVSATASWARQAQLYAYLVHRRGWPVPWGYYPRLRLVPPPGLLELAANDWYALPLTPRQIANKNRMILTYRSQMSAFDPLLRAFARRTEVFARVPDLSLQDLEADTELSAEPVNETPYLREHGDCDLEAVRLSPADGVYRLSIGTRRPLRAHCTLLISVHVVRPAAGAPSALLVTYEPGRAPLCQVTDGRQPAKPAPELAATVRQDGQTIEFLLPASWVRGSRGAIVDAMTHVGGRYTDHCLTRTYVHRELTR